MSDETEIIANNKSNNFLIANLPCSIPSGTSVLNIFKSVTKIASTKNSIAISNVNTIYGCVNTIYDRGWHSDNAFNRSLMRCALSDFNPSRLMLMLKEAGNSFDLNS